MIGECVVSLSGCSSGIVCYIVVNVVVFDSSMLFFLVWNCVSNVLWLIG